MAYKLKLPEGTKIHPVFHVNCLKKHLGSLIQSAAVLPEMIDDGLANVNHLAVLSRRLYKNGQSAGVQLLVQWVDQDANDATWEDYDEFKSRFPDFQFEP